MKAMQYGWQLGNDGMVISLTKQTVCIQFDATMPTTNGTIMGAKMHNVIPDVVNVGIMRSGTVEIDALH